MASSNPRGYNKFILFIDCETSGLHFHTDDPSYDPITKEEYQAVSWGMVVTDSATLDVVEELYVEIKWDGVSLWNKEAQKIHGLTLGYLEEHGKTDEDAVADILEMILKYWGPDTPVCVGGHNVATFDRPFLKRLLRKHGFDIKFGSKTIDTNAIGFATFGTHNSDDLFELVGLPPRTEHNSLTDANYARQAVKRIRGMFNACLDGE